MKKSEQLEMNKICEDAMISQASVCLNDKIIAIVKLDHCNAKIIETERYYLLRSYSTLVATVDKSTGNMYDLLRLVYGYTATSAKHISKFRNYYCTGKVYTYRNV